MAAFDAELDAQNPNAIPIPDPNRMAFLENQFQYLYAEVTHLRGVVNQPPPPPPSSTTIPSESQSTHPPSLLWDSF